MNIKKICIISLCISLIFSCTACRSNNNSTSESSNYTLIKEDDYSSFSSSTSNFDTSLIGKTFATGDYEYTFQVDGSVYISKYWGSESDISIPIELDGYDVAGIAEQAYRECASIVSLTIPGKVKEIGDYAFSLCSNLQNIVIEDGVEVLGAGSFYSCGALSHVVLPDTLTHIGNGAFSSSRSFTIAFDIKGSITIDGAPNEQITRESNGLLYIDRYVIGISPDYTGNITFDEDTLGIADSAFGNKYIYIADQAITFPPSLKFIGSSAFSGHNIDIYKIPNSVSYIGNCAIGYDLVNGAYQKFSNSSCKIYGVAGSTAEQYAIENGINFVIVKD